MVTCPLLNLECPGKLCAWWNETTETCTVVALTGWLEDLVLKNEQEE